MLTNIKSLSPVLVMISNMGVLICNRFHIRRANQVKITSLAPLFEGNPRTQRHEILSRKTRDLGAAHGEDFVILACTVLIQCQSVTVKRTDGWTNRRTEDRRTDAKTMAKTRETFCYRAQKIVLERYALYAISQVDCTR